MDCSLRQRLQLMVQRNSYFSREQVKLVFRQIVEAIEYLHRNQVLHRDLKTSNVLLKGLHTKVADFGFSRHFSLPLESFSPNISTLNLLSFWLDNWEIGFWSWNNKRYFVVSGA